MTKRTKLEKISIKIPKFQDTRNIRNVHGMKYDTHRKQQKVTFISNFVPVVASRPGPNKSGTR
ncbi:unnamed protein product [Larinioides sclopetarius]|uniref:Ribosomal protein S18 n=1 Tax=Larinioides sclopetarius TaxID=280406 RepID=A0AAV2A3I8_9ARAC